GVEVEQEDFGKLQRGYNGFSGIEKRKTKDRCRTFLSAKNRGGQDSCLA
ncbi:unnamed protein product, partial [Brassica oleracea var. botrytis]